MLNPHFTRRTEPTTFWVSVEPDGAGIVLSLYGELDMASAPELERRLKRLEWASASPVTIDLSGLDFIDSSGLHVLARAYERRGGAGLSLLRGPRRVHQVFELTGTALPFAD